MDFRTETQGADSSGLALARGGPLSTLCGHTTGPMPYCFDLGMEAQPGLIEQCTEDKVFTPNGRQLRRLKQRKRGQQPKPPASEKRGFG